MNIKTKALLKAELHKIAVVVPAICELMGGALLGSTYSFTNPEQHRIVSESGEVFVYVISSTRNLWIAPVGSGLIAIGFALHAIPNKNLKFKIGLIVVLISIVISQIAVNYTKLHSTPPI